MMANDSYLAYFDGACNPLNPGGTASYGAAIYRDGRPVWECFEIHSQGEAASNNAAEYAGFIAVLEWFAEQGLCGADIRILGDSNLVIQQMFGSWKIKKGLYAPLAYKARELLHQFTNVRGEWIPRDLNDVADRLSKAALKRAGAKLRIQPAG